MHELFKKTLYKNHGKAIGYWTIEAVTKGEGAELVISYAKTMDGQATVRRQEVKGVNIGKANETDPQDQAVSEAKSRAAKQLDKGYVETQEAATAPATNALGNKMPQLATPLEKVKQEKLDWDNAYGQPKLDGHRCMFKDGVLYSRNGKEINLPHILQAIKDSDLEDLHLDGELYSHGKVLQDIGSLIKDPREESNAIEFHLYDIVSDQPFIERYATLVRALTQGAHSFTATHTQLSGPLQLVPTVRIDSIEAWDVLHAKWLQDGYEGSMGRFGLDGYLDGKRSRNTLKRKDFSDGEYKVIGYRLGVPLTAKDGNVYQIPVWNLEVSPGGLTFEAVAAGTAAEKNAQAEKAESFIGKLNTIKHFGFTPAGIPNLPVSLRWYEPV